jgi:hypothetical protein
MRFHGSGFNNSPVRGLFARRSRRSILSSFKDVLLRCEHAEEIITGIIRVAKADEMNKNLFTIPDFNQS